MAARTTGTMLARGQLRDHAAKGCMQRDLGGDDVGEGLSASLDDRRGRLIATALYSQN
jgi:hypothetical protein